MELLMDERYQPIESILVALAPPEQQCGDFGGVLRSATILDLLSWIGAFISGSRFTDRGWCDDE
jgi:hypothetical protein